MSRGYLTAVNCGVAKIHANQLKLEAQAKQLRAQTQQFGKQTAQWLAMVERFNGAYQVRGYHATHTRVRTRALHSQHTLADWGKGAGPSGPLECPAPPFAPGAGHTLTRGTAYTTTRPPVPTGWLCGDPPAAPLMVPAPPQELGDVEKWTDALESDLTMVATQLEYVSSVARKP